MISIKKWLFYKVFNIYGCEKWLVCVTAGHIHWVYITEYRIDFYDISNPMVILLE